MNPVEGFVHLYHVWGLWGLITAIIYAPAAFREWRVKGGTLTRAPGEYVGIFGWQIKEAVLDLWRLATGIVHGLFGFGHVPPPETSPWRYTREHMLMLGIAVGGVSRLLTALYWSEKNRGWMDGDTVWVPAIPVLFAIIADAHHHHAAWGEKRPWLPRWLKIGAATWIALGLFRG